MVPDSVRATFFVFSCISGTFEIFASLCLGDDEEEVSLKMPSWPTAATLAGELGLAERERLRPFGPCTSCTNQYQPLRRLSPDRQYTLRQTLVGWRQCAKNMHNLKGLLDTRSASPRSPASIAAVSLEGILSQAAFSALSQK